MLDLIESCLTMLYIRNDVNTEDRFNLSLIYIIRSFSRNSEFMGKLMNCMVYNLMQLFSGYFFSVLWHCKSRETPEIVLGTI